MRRINPTTGIACMALFFSLAGTSLAARQHSIAKRCTATFRLVTGRTARRLRCGRTNPVVHVYINRDELLVVDLNRAHTAATFYGNETVVRVAQRGDNYAITAVTLLQHASLRMRLARSVTSLS